MSLHQEQQQERVRKNWRDGKTRIEEHLNKFIIGLVMEARKRQAERLEREQWHREREERERLWAERERLKFEEEQRLERLEKEIAAWQKSQRIRAYVQAVRDKAIQAHWEIAPGSELDTWISWATKQADRFDPLVKNSSE